MQGLARAIIVAVIAVLVGAVAPPTQATQDTPAEWRLLYSGGDLRDGTGALESDIRANIDVGSPVARFSPDGAMLATPELECLDSECDEVGGSVRVHEPDGTSRALASIADLDPRAVAWSPDGSQVAVLGRVLTPGDFDVRIYLFPLDGSPATQVYSDTMLLQITAFAGLSWNPVDDTLAFIATEFEQEEPRGPYFAVPGATDQVWTVPATALATPTRFTGRPVCGDCTRAPGYRQPTWSPDGSRLAVVRSRPLAPPEEEEPAVVGLLQRGALDVETIVESTPQDQLAWSDDGERLAYGVYDTSGDFYDETEVVDVGTGSVLATVEGIIAPFVDWLPCPSGTCQVWQEVHVPPQPSLNLKAAARRSKIVVSGVLGRVPDVVDVAVTLEKRVRAGSPWRTAGRTTVQAVEGLFKTSFARPRAVQCRARGVVTDGDSRATDTVVFRC